jgi:hypothetical protein
MDPVELPKDHFDFIDRHHMTLIKETISIAEVAITGVSKALAYGSFSRNGSP